MTILLIWTLELSKLRWHGMHRLSGEWAVTHASTALVLGSLFVNEIAGVAAAVMVTASFLALHKGPEGNWWSKPLWVRKVKVGDMVSSIDSKWHDVIEERPGPDRWHLLSFLSSWPVELGALWNLTSGFFLMSESNLWSLGLLYAGITALSAASVPFILWTDLLLKVTGKEWLRMRPTHWAKSQWSR